MTDTTTTASPAEEGENTAPQITIVDLKNTLSIIDVAAERGTFKGSELSAVGTIRDKLASFIANIPASEATEQNPEA